MKGAFPAISKNGLIEERCSEGSKKIRLIIGVITRCCKSELKQQIVLFRQSCENNDEVE